MRKSYTYNVICGILKALFVILSVLFAGKAALGAETQCPAGWEVKYKTENLCYVGTDETVVIPESITSLEKYAFYKNSSVRTIIIPNTVTCIQEYSIYDAPNLVNVIFYGDPMIEQHGIHKCPCLRSITVPAKGTRAYSFAERMDIPVKIGYDVGFPKSKAFLLEGDTYRQALCNTTEEPAFWKSSNTSVASVDGNGMVKARKAGKAKITAITQNGEYSYTVCVYKRTVSDRVKQIRKDETIKEKAKFERIKAVHTWMIRNIRYDYANYKGNSIPKSSYTVEGALLKKECVCAGYAAAFQKLMTAYNIPCKVVSGKAGGGGHAWNMVRLDGKWYHVDVTWDDPIVNGGNENSKLHYTYFLKSTAYMFAHNHTFTVSKYPACTSTEYDNVTEF